MSDILPASLPELIDTFIPLMPLTADTLAERLGLWMRTIDNPPEPPTCAVDAALELEDGTRVTHAALMLPTPERAGWAGFALENAALTLTQLRQRRADLKLVSAPSPNGSGEGRAWVFQLEVPKGWVSFCFTDGEETVSAINFRVPALVAEKAADEIVVNA